MMNKPILASIGLLAVVCIGWAVQVDASCWLDLLGSGPKVDFKGLNKWLVKTQPDEHADAKTNVAHVKGAKEEELQGTSLEYPASLFLDFMEANECNDHVLLAAKEMHKSRVNFQGLKRIERVLKSQLKPLVATCGPYIDKSVAKAYNETLEPSIKTFLEVVVLDFRRWPHPIGKGLRAEPDYQFERYLVERNSTVLDDRSSRWAVHLEKLSGEDPRTVLAEDRLNEFKGKYETVYHKEHFKQIRQTYLVEPCELLVDTLEDTFLGMYGLAQDNPEFIGTRSVAVKQLLYGYKKCKSFLKRRSCDVAKFFL